MRVGKTILIGLIAAVMWATAACAGPLTQKQGGSNTDIVQPQGSVITSDGTKYFGDKPWISTKAYSSVGDGVNDDTQEIQAAINAAPAGTEVFLPAGIYRLTTSILMKEGVYLRGVGFGWDWTGATYPKSGWNSGTSAGDPALVTQKATVIAIDYLAADTNIPTFRMVSNSGATGLVFTEWDQNPTAVTPTVYQPVFGLSTATVSDPNGTALVTAPILKNLYFINNYYPIKCSRCQYAEFENIHGNPLSVGISLDGSLDVNRIRDVFFSVQWNEADADVNKNIHKWMSANRTCLELKRSDEVQVLNFFCFGGNIGIAFRNGTITGVTGGTYGRFTNVTLDLVRTGVQVDKSGGGSVVFTNFDIANGTYQGTAVDTDSCFTFTDNSSALFMLIGGACRQSRGHGINYSPTTAANGNVYLHINGVNVQHWGMGATSGKSGLYVNPTNLLGGVIVTGSVFNGAQEVNGDFGINVDVRSRAIITGSQILAVDQAGAGIGFRTDAIDFVFSGNRVEACDKAISVITITDQFIISDNLLTTNDIASTVTCTTNCRILANAGDLEQDVKNGVNLTWN